MIRNAESLLAGRWYAVVLNGDVDGASFFRYEGDGCWSDNEGEPAERLWDPDIECYVSLSSADGYILQG